MKFDNIQNENRELKQKVKISDDEIRKYKEKTEKLVIENDNSKQKMEEMDKELKQKFNKLEKEIQEKTDRLVKENEESTLCIQQNSHVNNLIGAKTRNVAGWDLTDINNGQFAIAKSHSYYKKCGNGANWFGFKNSNPTGSIKTKLKGCGIGRLKFGSCHTSSSSTCIVRVFLDGFEIGKAIDINRNEITFAFNNNSELKLSESPSAIMQFYEFQVLYCKKCN